jgi:hypothetical protein
MIIPKALMPSPANKEKKGVLMGAGGPVVQYISAFARILAFSLLPCMFLAARARETNRM